MTTSNNTNNNDDTLDSLIQSVAGDLTKKFGEGSAMILGDDTSSAMHIPFWIRTNIPQLDYAVGGVMHPGIPGGRIVEVFGPESNGKTSLAQYIMKCAIDTLQALSVYQDTEHALSLERACQLGLDVNKVIFTQPETMEEVFEQQESIIDVIRKKSPDRPMIIVWDSVAATPTNSEVKGDYGDATMGVHARVMSQALRKITGLINTEQVAAVYINQIRDKINAGFGEKTNTFGGRALKFYSTVRLEVLKIETIKKDKGAPQGIRIRVTVKKNKVAPPLRVAEFNIYFDERGVDLYGSLLEFLKETGLIAGGKGWYTIEDKNYRIDEACELFMCNPDLYEKYLKMAYPEEKEE